MTFPLPGPYLEDQFFTIGGTKSPLTTSLVNSLLLDADPTLFYMRAYYQSIFSTHIAPRWNACITAAGLPGLDGYMPNQVLPYDPFRMELSKQNNWRFPLLAIYPVKTRYARPTTNIWHAERDFEVIFVLPPLTADQYELLFPFLQFSEKLILDRTMTGHDPSYNNDQLVWFTAGLEKIGINDSSIGDLHFGNIKYPTMRMSITVNEKVMFDARNFQMLDGYSQMQVSTTTDGYPPFNILTVDLGF